LGYSEDTLREELALPLSWKVHVNRMVTPKRLREYFQQHRQEFDGTQVRARHIVLQVPTGKESDELKAAEEKLRQVRTDIVDEKITFAEAAKKYSEAPSRENGGDVGFFPYRGKMPAAFSRVAFSLKEGEVSGPFRTPFGVHLCTLTAQTPGQLSLEDVRQPVLKQLSRELWNETVRKERAQAKIEWKIDVK